MSHFETGIIDVSYLRENGFLPSDERQQKGPVAVIECIQEIPCNPCVGACQFDAIHVNDNIALIDPHKCTLCGECVKVCPTNAIEQLASLRETLGDRLVLHGKLPSTSLFTVLDECVALLAPSLEEMFGNQLIEALMRGCHGIVAEGTALAENVRRFGNGAAVARNDPVALAAAVDDVLACPIAAEAVESARQAIRNYMSPTAVAEKHRALYERIVSAFKLAGCLQEGRGGRGA